MHIRSDLSDLLADLLADLAAASKVTGIEPGKDSGFVLVAAMLLLAILSLLAVAGMGTSTAEVKIASHDRDAKQAFYLCEAAIEVAKYQTTKGWGKGQGAGASSPYAFEFDVSTMPATLLSGSGSTLAWEDGKWVNFTLVDVRGLEYTIEAHDSSYKITQCSGSDTPPNWNASAAAADNDRVRIYFKSSGVSFSGSGAVEDNIVEVDGNPGWDDNIWNGYELRDVSSGVKYSISSNIGNIFMLSGNPPTSSITFEILSGVGGDDSFTIFDEQPNSTWQTSDSFGNGEWVLIDEEENTFVISGAVVQSLPERLVLEVDGTPGDGSFQLVSNPWLTEALTTKTFTAGPNGDFISPTGITSYGGVKLTASHADDQGNYQLEAESTGVSTGNVKVIQIDARLDPAGNVIFSNWRQIR